MTSRIKSRMAGRLEFSTDERSEDKSDKNAYEISHELWIEFIGFGVTIKELFYGGEGFGIFEGLY